MIIVYTNRCLCPSKDKARLAEIKRQYNDVQVRRVALSQVWAEEARRYGVAMPFYVDEDLICDFYSGETM